MVTWSRVVQRYPRLSSITLDSCGGKAFGVYHILSCQFFPTFLRYTMFISCTILFKRFRIPQKSQIPITVVFPSYPCCSNDLIYRLQETQLATPRNHHQKCKPDLWLLQDLQIAGSSSAKVIQFCRRNCEVCLCYYWSLKHSNRHLKSQKEIWIWDFL